MAEAYRIQDEPAPGTLARFALNPFWPFLAVMFGGLWLSWPLFALNSLAIGSATRRRELLLLGGGFLTVTAAAFGVFALAEEGSIGPDQVVYWQLGLIVLKLIVTYRVHMLQARSFELYEYFGGASRNGMLVLFAGFLGRSFVAGAAGGPWLWVLS